MNETAGGRRALQVARRLCMDLQVQLLAVHVVEKVPLSPEPRRDARAQGERLVTRMLAELRLVDADWRVSIGDPSEEIAEIADREMPHAIVLGSTSHRHLWQSALRSHLANDLAHRCACPVLVVPLQEPDIIHHEEDGISDAARPQIPADRPPTTRL